MDRNIDAVVVVGTVLPSWSATGMSLICAYQLIHFTMYLLLTKTSCFSRLSDMVWTLELGGTRTRTRMLAGFIVDHSVTKEDGDYTLDDEVCRRKLDDVA